MQTLGRRYVRYINHSYRRSGTLRESGTMQAWYKDRYLLTCYRYIDLNPVAGLLCQQPAIVPQWCPLTNQHHNPIQQSIGH